MRALLLSVAGLALCAGIAAAEEKVTVTEQAMRIGDPTVMICKTGPSYAGSRIGAKKTCHSRGVWKQIQANGQYDIDHMQTSTENTYLDPPS